MPCMLTKHEQFVEVFVGGFRPDFRGFSGDAHRRDHPVVDVGRHAGHAVGVGRIVSTSGVAVESLVLERLPAGEGGLFSALEPPYWVHRRVDVALLEQVPALVEVGELMFDHDGFKRQVTIVSVHAQVQFRPAALEPLFPQFLRGVAEFEGAVH